MPAGCILWVQQSVSAGNGQPLACAAVLQPVPVSYHFRGCKAPLSRIVSGAISTFTFTFSLSERPVHDNNNYYHHNNKVIL